MESNNSMNSARQTRCAPSPGGYAMSESGQLRKSGLGRGMSEAGGRAEVDFGRLEVSLCRVGPGNFTPSPSQNRT